MELIVFFFSGLASLLVIIVISGQALITFTFPKQEKTINYYLIKDFASCSVLFIAIPLIIVTKNQKMQNYFWHHLKQNQLVVSLMDLYLASRGVQHNKVGTTVYSIECYRLNGTTRF